MSIELTAGKAAGFAAVADHRRVIAALAIYRLRAMSTEQLGL